MWASALARASSRALRASANGSLLRKYAHPIPPIRTFCETPSAKPPPKGEPKTPKEEAHSKKESNSKKPNYEDYFVRRKGSSSKSPFSGLGGISGSSGSSNGNGNGSSWEDLMPYALASGVAASYLYFVMKGSKEDEVNSSDTMPNSGSDGASTPGRQVSWKEFKGMLRSGRVSKVEVINGQIANVYFKEDPMRPRARFTIGSVETLERKLERAQEDLGFEPHEFVPVVYNEETSLGRVLVEWVPTLAFIAFYVFVARRFNSGGGFPGGMGGGRSNNRSATKGPFGGSSGRKGPFGGMGGGQGGIFNVGKAQVTVLNRDDNKVDISFKDVAGLDEAKEEIMEFVQYLKKPDKYKELGAKIPKGALMYGPPGTGKTLLAKATAGEAGVPFLTMSGSDFMEMFVGVGPSRVRDLFSQARGLAPCIIFLDEIDAIGRKRGRGGFVGGNDERENTLNQLLVEMDGFASNSGVVVLAGTNRSDVLDPALLRPGRFDRQISIDPPDIAGRKQIFDVHLKGVKVADPPGKDQVAKSMAARTPGFAGADIANVCNEAALVAARLKKEVVELDDFEAAVDRVVAGLEKKNLLMSPEEKRTIAYHEAGHAVAGWFLEHAMPLLKVSIIPRGSAALGYAQYQPMERNLASMETLEDQMCMTLAGRASEEIFFDTVTTGAADDFNKVTRIAYQSVAEWGLGKTVRNLAFPSGNDGDQFYKPYSDKMAREIDEEVRDIVSKAYQRTTDLLIEKKDAVVMVANLLLEKEAIGREDMVKLLGERAGGADRSSFDEILEDSSRKLKSEGKPKKTK